MLPENYAVIYNVLNVCFAFESSIGFSYSILFGTRVRLCVCVSESEKRQISCCVAEHGIASAGCVMLVSSAYVILTNNSLTK